MKEFVGVVMLLIVFLWFYMNVKEGLKMSKPVVTDASAKATLLNYANETATIGYLQGQVALKPTIDYLLTKPGFTTTTTVKKARTMLP